MGWAEGPPEAAAWSRWDTVASDRSGAETKWPCPRGMVTSKVAAICLSQGPYTEARGPSWRFLGPKAFAHPPRCTSDGET